MDGTAESGDDYATATGTLTIAAGDQSANHQGGNRGRSAARAGGDVRHSVQRARGGDACGTMRQSGQSFDDDPVPGLAVEDASALEGCARNPLYGESLERERQSRERGMGDGGRHRGVRGRLLRRHRNPDDRRRRAVGNGPG